jgi:eukaryotic-like serine/threonine-protein kinase
VKGIRSFAQGQKCGPYRIVRELGRGGMAIVYLAVGPSGEEVAVKVLQLTRALDPEQRRRFDREIVALASIIHHNVVAFRDTGVLDGGDGAEIVYLAMEYVRGHSLRHVMHPGRRFPPDEIANIMGQVAEGVTAAHALHIIHRDLKPENVMVTADNRVVVIDFGLGKLRMLGMSSSGEHRKAVGTMGYLAPEQLSGSMANALDERVDVHALGVMLHELAVGAHPFARGGATPGEIMGMTCQLVPPLLHDAVAAFPEDLARIAERALEKDREQRFATMAEMRDAIYGAGNSFVARRRQAVLSRFRPGMTLATNAKTPASEPSERGGWTPQQPRTIRVAVPEEALAHAAAKRVAEAAPAEAPEQPAHAPLAEVRNDSSSPTTTSQGLSVAPLGRDRLGRDKRIARAVAVVAAIVCSFLAATGVRQLVRPSVASEAARAPSASPTTASEATPAASSATVRAPTSGLPRDPASASTAQGSTAQASAGPPRVRPPKTALPPRPAAPSSSSSRSAKLPDSYPDFPPPLGPLEP